MSFSVINPDEQTWETRPHEDGEPARHVTELSELAGMEHVRANVWRYEPGAAGRRHRHVSQDETFVVLAGTLSIYAGDPPERHDVPAGSLVHTIKASHSPKAARITPYEISTKRPSPEGFPGVSRPGILLDAAIP